MRSARKPITAVLVVIGALALTAAPALAGNGYEKITSTFGSNGSGPGEFKEPTAIAVNDETEEVYVLDWGNNRVEAFNKKHEFQFEFNGAGSPSGKFLNPEGIAVDSDPASTSYGDVYVADAGHGVVDKFGSTGKYEGQIGGPFGGQLNVAVDAAGNVWVYEPTSGSAGEVYEFNDEGTQVGPVHELQDRGEAGPVPGFAVDANGNIYLSTDTRLYRYGPAKNYEREFIIYERPGLGQAALAIILSTGSLLLDEGSNIELFKSPIPEGAQSILKFSTTGLSDSGGIAVNGAKGDGTIYATQRGFDDVDVFATEPAKAPVVVSESAFSTSSEEGGFSAVVDPENRTTMYSFEYSRAASTNGRGELELTGTIHTIAGETTIPAEFGDNTGTVSGGLFEPEKTYYYRVVAENEESKGTPTVGKVEAYTKIPLIAESEEKFSELTSTSATLEAGINPVFEGTTYAFEYAESEAELKNGKGTVIHGTTGTHQLEKLSEFDKMEEALDQEVKEEQEGKLPPGTVPPGTVPICPGIVEEGGTGILQPGVNKPCPVSAELFGLTPGQTYYYRVVTKNEVTEYASNANKGVPVTGQIKEFTPYAAPAVTTGGAQNITGTAATLSGEVNPERTEAKYYFAYIGEAGYNKALENGAADPASPHYQEELAKGAASPYAEGEATATNALPVGNHPVTVGPIPATDLLPGETYHYALVAVNKYAIQTIGPDQTFTTQAGTPPLVNTGGASGVSQNSATLSGTVATNGLQTNYGFEIGSAPGNYGPATGLGAIGGATTETVYVTLSKLQPGRTYYYRITATNADGTEKGQPESFATPGFPSLIAPPPSLPLVDTPDISFPKEEKPSGISTKALTSREKLAKALKACRAKKGKKRRSCEAAAHRKRPVGPRKAGEKGNAGPARPGSEVSDLLGLS